jgi:hypothetical protein
METMLAILACVLVGQDPAPSGVYQMCNEVEGYSGETLELKDGKVRYWFYSDVQGGKEPKYPLEGTYTVKGETITFEHPDFYAPKRTLAVVNGVSVVWRDDGLKLYKEKQRLQPYAVLIKVEHAVAKDPHDGRPSISSLETEEMRKRDKKEYEERDNDLPEEVRVLLRARSLRGDSNMDVYKREIARARAQPDPKLLAQIAALLGQGSKQRISAMMILEDLFAKTFLVPEPPPFLQDPKEMKTALESLIGALSAAKDRSAVEELVMTFLRVSGAGKIALDIPEAGVRIKLEAKANGAKSYGSSAPKDDIYWVKVMPKVIPACQQWMREQLPK